jgi:hypothetical protein
MKAFDTIEHNVIIHMMRQLGFDETWCDWIQRILISGTPSILLNGVPGKHFHCKRGVRQGDPLSPSSSCWLLIFFNVSSTKVTEKFSLNSPFNHM